MQSAWALHAGGTLLVFMRMCGHLPICRRRCARVYTGPGAQLLMSSAEQVFGHARTSAVRGVPCSPGALPRARYRRALHRSRRQQATLNRLPRYSVLRCSHQLSSTDE
jgi:hypothetical protein